MREFSAQAEKYLTTHHERDLETGLDYRGARFYDCDVARFLSLDPLAADYPVLSDYCYVAGNPIRFIDSDGRQVVDPKTGKQVHKVNGKWQAVDGSAVSKQFIKYSQPTLDALTSSDVGTKIYKELQAIRTIVTFNTADRKNLFDLSVLGGNSRWRTAKNDFSTGTDGLYNEVIITPALDKIKSRAAQDGIDFEEKLIQTISVEKDHIVTREQIDLEKSFDYDLFSSDKVVEKAYGQLLQNAVV